MPIPSELSKQIQEPLIPLCVPEIRGNEWKYVKECLDTNWVSSVGHFVDRFEQMVADYVGTKYAVATVNGTAALHIALLVAGVQPDDEVLVSTLSFIAPANAIRYVGAWPVFIDAEPGYWQMDPEKLKDFLTKSCRWRNGELYNQNTRRRVKAILPVHILGHPCDLDPILECARTYNLIVIEDAAESLGARYKGRRVGQLGDISCLSFNGNKIVTASGGGMVLTDHEVWARRAKYLIVQAVDDALARIHNEIGYNYRLTNIQAAIGCAQLEQINEYIEAKRQIAAVYKRAFKNTAHVTVQPEAPWAFSIYWMYTVLMNGVESEECNRSVVKYLASTGVQARMLWQPLHLSPAHRSAYAYGGGHVAERIFNSALSLPSSVGLSAADQGRVIEQIVEISGKNRKVT